MATETLHVAMPGNLADLGTQLVNIDELGRRSGLSISTLHRLRKAGKIPSFQPGGKGARVLFPADAIEQSTGMTSSGGAAQVADVEANSPERLSGPRPSWMRP